MEKEQWSNPSIGPAGLCFTLCLPQIVPDTLQRTLTSAFAKESNDVLEECFGNRGELSALLAKDSLPDDIANRTEKYLPIVLGLVKTIPAEAVYTCTWRSGLGKNRQVVGGHIDFERGMVLTTQALAIHNAAIAMVSGLPWGAAATYNESYKAATKQLMVASSILQYVISGLAMNPLPAIMPEVNSTVLGGLMHLFNAEAHMIVLTLALPKRAGSKVLAAHIQRELQLASASFEVTKGTPYELDCTLMFHCETLSFLFATMSRRVAALEARDEALFANALGQLHYGLLEKDKMQAAKRKADGVVYSSYLNPNVLAVVESERTCLEAAKADIDRVNGMVCRAQPNLEVEAPFGKALSTLQVVNYEPVAPAFEALTLKEGGGACSLM